MSFRNGRYQRAEQLDLDHNGSRINPTAIVMHYTVTDTLADAVRALNRRGLSYTFLIDRDGTVHQTRRPDEHAAHAGRSHWKSANNIQNTSSLNRSSVGISFVSRGYFRRLQNGNAFDVDAHDNLVGETYPESEVQRASAPYDPGWRPIWHKYTDEQLESADALVVALKDEYPAIRELVGHDDVSIDGKSDTGPLFPMQQWREAHGLEGGLGFRTTIQSPDGVAELRRGSSTRHSSLDQLRNGTEVFVRAFAYTYSHQRAIEVDRERRRYITRWASIDHTGQNKHSGFVHASLLRDTPLSQRLKDGL